MSLLAVIEAETRSLYQRRGRAAMYAPAEGGHVINTHVFFFLFPDFATWNSKRNPCRSKKKKRKKRREIRNVLNKNPTARLPVHFIFIVRDTKCKNATIKNTEHMRGVSDSSFLVKRKMPETFIYIFLKMLAVRLHLFYTWKIFYCIWNLNFSFNEVKFSLCDCCHQRMSANLDSFH